jgi:hypothetical protein
MMNRSMIFSLALLSSPTFLCAQSKGLEPAPPSATQVNPSLVMAVRLSYMTGSCPVGLMAQRQGTGNVVQVGSSRPVPTQKLRLTVDNFQDKGIVAATVTVRGYDASPRFMPLHTNSRESHELTKTVDLKVDVASGKTTATNLTVKSLASVSWVELESLEYGDGTQWNASAGKSCRVEPNKFLLVAER